MGLIPTATKLHNNLGRVVRTYVPLSPSSITWYWSENGDVFRLGRWPQAWRNCAESNGSLPLEMTLKSPADWLPVHRDWLWTQRSVSSMGKLYFFSHCKSNACFRKYRLSTAEKLVEAETTFHGYLIVLHTKMHLDLDTAHVPTIQLDIENAHAYNKSILYRCVTRTPCRS